MHQCSQPLEIVHRTRMMVRKRQREHVCVCIKKEQQIDRE